MPRRRAALLATETSTGRGHVVNLTTMARALAGRFVLDAVTPDRPWQEDLLPFCRQVLMGPTLKHDVNTYLNYCHQPFNPVTLGDLLVLYGFREKQELARQIRWWQDVMWRQKTELLVADFAPCAMFAARSLGIPVVNTGMAVTVPPTGMKRFAPILEEDGPKPQINEFETVLAINEALCSVGVPEISSLPDVFQSDVRLPCSFPFWDPYMCWRDGPYQSPLRKLPPESDGRGPEIFLYLSDHVMHAEALLEALGSLRLPVRAVSAGRHSEEIARLKQFDFIVEQRQVAMEDIVKKTRLILCAGQAGTCALALLSGIPLIAFPQYKEQIANARGAEHRGGAKVFTYANWGLSLSAAELAREISHVYRNENYHDHTRKLASQLRNTVPSDTVLSAQREMARVM